MLLAFEPLPVAWKKRNLSADYAQRRAAGAWLDFRRDDAGEDIVYVAPKIEIDLLACLIVKNEHAVRMFSIDKRFYVF